MDIQHRYPGNEGVSFRKVLVMAGALAMTVATTSVLAHPILAALVSFSEDSCWPVLGELTPGDRPNRSGAVKIAILDIGIDLDHPGNAGLRGFGV
jgi:hypothetical protein